MTDQTWFPPTTLTGRHWRVEILHGAAEWRWYTEHLTPEHASTFCAYKSQYYPTHQWRVVEGTR